MTDEPNTRPPSERPGAQVREALANRLGEIAGRVPLERDRETIIEACNALRALTAERPEAAVAWLVPSDETGLCRIWWRDKERAEAWLEKHPHCTLIPLYAIQHEEPGRETNHSPPHRGI